MLSFPLAAFVSSQYLGTMKTLLRSSFPLLVLLLACTALRGADSYDAQILSKVLFRANTDVAGHPIVYPKTEKPELSGFLVEIPPGAETGWHLHPNPCMAYVLEGVIEVTQEGGPTRIFSTGDSFVELVNTRHNGRNKGGVSVKILLFVVGEKNVGPSTK
jgi:quercetin dioxygenase-like cupin family protein